MTVPFSENGGFAATNFYLFVPTQDAALSQSYIGIFDPTSFDDPVDGTSYAYRQEDVMPARVPTVRRVVLTYRDLGVAHITVTVQGINDNGNTVVSSVPKTIGTKAATGLLMTAFCDVQLTAFRPQIVVSRPAGGGPLSIVRATMVGEVEEVTL